MRIAFVITQYYSPRASGVIKQALNWKQALEAHGVEVELLNPWHHVTWKGNFDIVHIYSGAYWAMHLVCDLVKLGVPVVHSPILDTSKNKCLYRIMSHVPMLGHKIYTMPAVQRRYGSLCSLTLSRSSDEARILRDGVGLPSRRIRFVPISMQAPSAQAVPVDLSSLGQAPWCLHVSQYTQDRKNVRRLARACVEGGLALVICGDPGSVVAKRELESDLAGVNYCILDFVGLGQLRWLYENCDVFALPSLYEGVGLAALEAAYFGAPVVGSEIGGTKDYLNAHAQYADPYSIASIRGALGRALSLGRSEIRAEYIKSKYTAKAVGSDLAKMYCSVCSSSE